MLFLQHHTLNMGKNSDLPYSNLQVDSDEALSAAFNLNVFIRYGLSSALSLFGGSVLFQINENMFNIINAWSYLKISRILL